MTETRMTLKVLIATAVVLGSASPIAAQSGTSTDAEREVMAVVNAVFDGMRKVDSAMVRPLFHPQARQIAMDLRGEGRPPRFDSLEAFLQAVARPRTELFDERLSNVKTMIDGSLASVWADYKFYRNTTLSHCGVDHFLLVKEGGAWKIIELADTRRTMNC
jgi:hypothetical protein